MCRVTEVSLFCLEDDWKREWTLRWGYFSDLYSLVANRKTKHSKILTLTVSSSAWNLTFKMLSWDFPGMQNRKSRDTWSNRQIWPSSTEWSKSIANRVFPREGTGHNRHPSSTAQEKTLHKNITRWSIPKLDWLYSLQPKMEKLYDVIKKQEQEMTVTQIMNSVLPNSDLNWKK